MDRIASKGLTALLLFTVLTISAACASSSSSASKAPDWTQRTPPPDGMYTYFVGYSDAEAGGEASGTDAAVASLVAEIMRYIGVSITADSTAVAVATVNDFQSSIVQTVKQSSTSRIAGFQVQEKYVAKRQGGITVYILGRYETNALDSERRRISALFQEKIDAVARPEALGKELLEEGNAAAAAVKFLEAAAAASSSDIENADVKLERNLNAAKDAVSRIALTKLKDNLSGAPGAPFPEPFRTAVKAGSVPQVQAPFTVSYQAKLPNGRLTTKTVSAASGPDGVVEFTPPNPDFVGKATLTVRLDLGTSLDTLSGVPERFKPLVAAVEDEVAAKRVSFAYVVVSAARTIPTAVMVADIDSSGAASVGTTTNALLAALSSKGFSVSQASFAPDAVAAGDDAAVLAAAKKALAGKSARLVYGTTRIVASKEDSGQKLVTVSADVKAVDLSSGQILYAVSKQTTAVSSSDRQAAEAARRMLGQKSVGDELAANLP